MIRFFDLKLNDAQPPLITEDSFRVFAGAADLQDLLFDSLYRATREGWTLDEGVQIEVVVRAPRYDDGFSIWDDSVTEWMDGSSEQPASSEAYWGTQSSAWSDGICRWS